jgi:Type II secretion system (T2SS), protein M
VTARDRLMLMGIALIAVLGGVWMLAVSPARKQESKAAEEVASARSALAQAQTEVAEAHSARSRYRSAYASLASLGQAVPTSPEVPTLVYALDKASNNHHVEFSSITTSGGGSGSSSSSSAASSSSASAATGAPFTQVPFTFTFAGNYQDLVHLLAQIERFTVQSPGGPVEVSGRLLTIQSISLGAGGGSSTSSSSGAASAAANEMTWSITASAYILAPASMAAGATETAGSAAQPSAAPSAPSGTSVAPTPAVVKAGG